MKACKHNGVLSYVVADYDWLAKERKLNIKRGGFAFRLQASGFSSCIYIIHPLGISLRCVLHDKIEFNFLVFVWNYL